jgi:group I intron endonuclease
MYIYQIFNTKTGVSYFGQSRQKNRQRIWTHRHNLRKNKHSNRYLQNAWNKYGEESFEFNILHDSVESIESLDELEKMLISDNKSYNLTSGGESFEHTDETKKKLRDIMLEKAKNPQFRQELSERVNNWRNPISVKNHSQKLKDFWQSERGKLIHKRASKEVWASDERRKKQSDIIKKQIEHDPSILDRLRIQSKNGAEKAKLARQKTYVGFIDPTGKIYSNIVNLNEFCRIHKLCSTNLNRIDKGKQKTYKGWKKYNPDE